MLLCTGFLSYSGPFNQEFRDMLMGKWQKDMKSRKIPFTSNLNVTAMLVDAATVNIDCFDTIHKVCIQVAQNSFQQLDLNGQYYLSLPLDAAIMQLKHGPIIEHVVIIFVTHQVTIKTPDLGAYNSKRAW